MDRLPALIVGAFTLMAAFAMTPSANAQAPALATLTFNLTVNGTPAPSDAFVVEWGETGVTLCSATCAGGGRVYSKAESFPVGATETFLFARAFAGRSSDPVARQVFWRQTITIRSDRTVHAVFDYGPSVVIQPPSTGGAPAYRLGSMLVLPGLAIFALGLRRRPRDVKRRVAVAASSAGGAVSAPLSTTRQGINRRRPAMTGRPNGGA